MRNTAGVLAAAAGKPVLCFSARHDHPLVQPGDGYAALAGAARVTTEAQGSLWGGRGVGTVPHALIAAFGGDPVAAARVRATVRGLARHHRAGRLRQRFRRHLARRRRSARRRSLGAARHLGSGGRPGARGSARSAREARRGDAELVRRVRSALDDAGHDRVRIVVSVGSTLSGSRRSSVRVPPWMPTGWARRCAAARTTSPPTWSGSTGAAARRRVAGAGTSACDRGLKRGPTVRASRGAASPRGGRGDGRPRPDGGGGAGPDVRLLRPARPGVHGAPPRPSPARGRDLLSRGPARPSVRGLLATALREAEEESAWRRARSTCSAPCRRSGPL